MKKIINFFNNSFQKTVFIIFSLTLGMNSLFFIAREVEFLSPLKLTESALPFYLIYLLLTIVLIIILFFSNNFKNGSINWNKTILFFLLIILPSEIILIFGTNESKHFHWIFQLATGLYVIIFGIFLLYLKNHTQKPPSFQNISFKKWFTRQEKIVWITVPLAISIYLLFGLFNLGKFAAVDEPLWTFDRIPSYWKNIAQQDWNGTRISDKPGITVAILSGIGLLWENPTEYKMINNNSGGEKASLKNIERLNLALRLPIFLFVLISIPLFFFLIANLLGKTTALFSVIFISLSPILLGMSRIINPDSLLWIFSTLFLLSFLIYQKEHNFYFLYLAGILLGLGLLTKYISNILIILLIGVIFFEYVFKKNNDDFPSTYVRNSLFDFTTIIFIALSSFYLLFPGTWVKPERLLNATIFSEAFVSTWHIFAIFLLFIVLDLIFLKSKLTGIILNFFRKLRFQIMFIFALFFISSMLFVFINTLFGMPFFNFEEILASPKSSYAVAGPLGLFFANFYPLLFGISPLILLFLFLALFLLFNKKNISKTSTKTIFYFSLLIIIYYLGTTINNVGATVRYQIILYPAAFIISAIGLSEVLKIKPKLSSQKTLWFLLITIFTFLTITLFQIKPFYFSYSNFLLPEKYVLNLKDMGDGSYQAAQYLNALPQAEKLSIWTDKNGVCMFFKGTCYSSLDYKKMVENNLVQTFDYYVISAGRESRTTKLVSQRLSYNPKYLVRFDKLYSFPNPDFELNIANKKTNYIKIIKANRIDLNYVHDPTKPSL